MEAPGWSECNPAMAAATAAAVTPRINCGGTLTNFNLHVITLLVRVRPFKTIALP